MDKQKFYLTDEELRRVKLALTLDYPTIHEPDKLYHDLIDKIDLAIAENLNNDISTIYCELDNTLKFKLGSRFYGQLVSGKLTKVTIENVEGSQSKHIIFEVTKSE